MSDDRLTRVTVQDLVAPVPLLLLPLKRIRGHPISTNARGDAAHKPWHVPILQRALVPGLLKQRADRVYDRSHVRQEVLVRFRLERTALIPFYLCARARCDDV